MLVVTVLAYPVYFWLLRVTSPTLVSTFAFVAPLVAVTLGVAVLGETLTMAMLGAAGLILLGVVAITLGQRTWPGPCNALSGLSCKKLPAPIKGAGSFFMRVAQ